MRARRVAAAADVPVRVAEAAGAPPRPAAAEAAPARDAAAWARVAFAAVFVGAVAWEVPDAPALAAAAAAASTSDVLALATERAFKGGVAGAAAGVLQVCSFMWMRTAMNVQYANGGELGDTLRALWREGGVRRFYRGVGFAVVQAPLSRFGDTAANAGGLLLLEVYAPDLPVAVKSVAVSALGATWRILLTPVDTFKTTQQVRGDGALAELFERLKTDGPGALYRGAFANFAANWVGSYPWFATFNTLQASVPAADGVGKLVRNAAIGFCASAVSDTCSNSLRVVKTMRQTDPTGELGYVDAAKAVVERDGFIGLFGRGLRTRLLVNAAQGMVFSVVWKAIEERLVNGA